MFQPYSELSSADASPSACDASDACSPYSAAADPATKLAAVRPPPRLHACSARTVAPRTCASPKAHDAPDAGSPTPPTRTTVPPSVEPLPGSAHSAKPADR